MAIASTSSGNDYGMTGQYQATWQAINEVIGLRNQDVAAVEREIQQALAQAQGSDFDPARINGLIAKLDALTTPQPVALPTAPYIGPLTYTQKPLPALAIKNPLVPTAPGERYLMDFGSAPELETAGDPSSMQDYRHLMVQERDALLAMVQQGFKDFVAEFMPTHTGEAAQWLSDAIQARNTGIPLQVEAQIHERNRARIHKETTRQVATAKATWAGKGFTLPPGALVGQVHELRRDQAEQLATSSRELAIYVSDKHIETIRFAIEQSVSMRASALSAALDYMKALIVSPQQVGEWITAMIDNRTKVAQAEADIFKARAGVATDVFKAQTGADVDKFKTLADVTLEDAKQGNASQVEVFRALLAQEQHGAQFALEQFRTRTGTDLEAYKVATSALLQHYEAETKVAALKSDVIGRTAETSLKLEDLKFTRENQINRMRVDVAMERLKTYAQQAAAALNNLQLNASINTSYNVSARAEE